MKNFGVRPLRDQIFGGFTTSILHLVWNEHSLLKLDITLRIGSTFAQNRKRICFRILKNANVKYCQYRDDGREMNIFIVFISIKQAYK